ncbi:MAG: YheV family putative metal-binding protein [Pseudomonadota bacterium]
MVKQRFIAGAVCPRCREIDRIVVRRTPAGDERACVACDFREAAQTGASTAGVPRGKPERARDGGSGETSVVRLVTPKPPEQR